MEKTPPKENRYCHNCHYPMSPYGEYCPHCSQKYTDGRITVWELFHDFLDNVLNLDSKIFRTLGHLMIPGKLTNEYFMGHHKRYVSPLRIFFLMAIFHFAVLGYWTLNDLEASLTKFDTSDAKEAHKIIFLEELDSARQKVERRFNRQPIASAALDSLYKQVKDTTLSDSTDLGYAVLHKDWNMEFKQFKVSLKDLFEKSPDSLLTDYKITNFWMRMELRQAIRIRRNGSNFVEFAFGKLLWMVVLMMPALALTLKLLYIRRKRYFVEHLIFSFHYHAFAFFIMAMAFIFIQIFSQGPLTEDDWGLTGFAFLGILLYLFIAMRKVYKQGYIKTFFKYSMLNFSYLIIFVICFVLILVVSALMY